MLQAPDRETSYLIKASNIWTTGNQGYGAGETSVARNWDHLGRLWRPEIEYRTPPKDRDFAREHILMLHEFVRDNTNSLFKTEQLFLSGAAGVAAFALINGDKIVTDGIKVLIAFLPMTILVVGALRVYSQMILQKDLLFLLEVLQRKGFPDTPTAYLIHQDHQYGEGYGSSINKVRITSAVAWILAISASLVFAIIYSGTDIPMIDPQPESIGPS
jgi:hypothetical protein